MHGVIGNTSCISNGNKLNYKSPHSGLVTFKPRYTNTSSDFYNEFSGFPTQIFNSSRTSRICICFR